MGDVLVDAAVGDEGEGKPGLLRTKPEIMQKTIYLKCKNLSEKFMKNRQIILDIRGTVYYDIGAREKH